MHPTKKLDKALLEQLLRESSQAAAVHTSPTVPRMAAISHADDEPLDILDEWIVLD